MIDFENGTIRIRRGLSVGLLQEEKATYFMHVSQCVFRSGRKNLDAQS